MSFLDEVRKITYNIEQKEEQKHNDIEPIKKREEIKSIEKIIKKKAKKGEYYVDVYYKYDETLKHFQELGFHAWHNGFDNFPPYSKIMRVNWESKE